MLTQTSLVGVRDPYGIRPLVIGKLNNSYVLSSETCALDIIGAKFVREVDNGEIVLIKDNKIQSIKPFPPRKIRPCVFEYIYFSRPDSILNGKSAYEYRKNLGKELAKESNLKADIVVPVPDSGNDYDGGWNKTITELDINKAHMSVVYVKRTTSQSSGNFYHGTGTTSGQILNLNGTNNTNPYFMATGVSILPENVWCVSIGIIQANHDSNTTTSGQYNDRVGIYRLDTGQKLNTASTYKFGSGGATLTNGHRVFLYLSLIHI